MDEYVKRSDVINSVCQFCKDQHKDELCTEWDICQIFTRIANVPPADVIDRNEGIKMGAELAAMHGSDATSQDLEKAYFKGMEEGYKRIQTMYDKLIKRLRECTAEMNGEKTLWHQAADAIEELQKQLREEKVDNVNLTGWLAEEHAKHRWIPVTERLPKEHENVLVADKENNICIASYEPLWDGMVWNVLFDNKILPVTHWMPLPEPPKDGPLAMPKKREKD